MNDAQRAMVIIVLLPVILSTMIAVAWAFAMVG
jgi:hypothetical protein